MNLRLAPIFQTHPLESLMAAGLLLGLLFIAADGTNPQPASQPVMMAAEKN